MNTLLDPCQVKGVLNKEVKMKIKLTLFATVMFLIGCSTLNSVIKAKEEGKGTVQVYDVSEDDAWRLAMKSFRWAGSDAIEEHRQDGYMLTTKGVNWVTSGSVMGAWINPLSDNKVEVTVISKRRISTEIATGMTEGKFHRLFQAGLDIINRGEPLPLSAPDLN